MHFRLRLRHYLSAVAKLVRRIGIPEFFDKASLLCRSKVEFNAIKSALAPWGITDKFTQAKVIKFEPVEIFFCLIATKL
jgi:hypothetical protein